MLGLLVLALTTLMIYTLVKNALFGLQLSPSDQYNGSIEVIYPISQNAEIYFENWKKALSDFRTPQDLIKIHILIDGFNPNLAAWQELSREFPQIVVQHYPMRPAHLEAEPWMLEQISQKINAQVVMIGDCEIAPAESALISIAKNVVEKNRTYFVIPQNAKISALGEAIYALNPTLAYTSIFGFRKWRREFSHHLLSISKGIISMDLKHFKSIDFKSARISTWKEVISRQWNDQGETYYLAFGEKLLLRYYSKDIKVVIQKTKENWKELWMKKYKMSFWLYILALFVWSFPVLCLLTHPFWSIASLFLLTLYRFFSKIVFQESWSAIALHPAACLVWIYSLGLFVIENLRSSKMTQVP